MPEETARSAQFPLSLPESPHLDWLRKQAKRRLEELRKTNPSAKLAEAQFDLAKQHGFSSWRALKSHIDSLTIDGQLVNAARAGDVETLRTLLDKYPEKLHVRVPPYEASLLFPAAQSGNVAAVDLLLKRGLDVNYREKGDNTYAMHWVAAQGNLEMVRTLADAGGDVIGEGDDHAGGVIGWASCWEGCDDDAHRAVVDFLISRGARHHIFSAIAMNLADEVRRIVAAAPAALNQRQSRNENHLTPLHFAVKMKRPQMVGLLLELGADPRSVDGGGMPVAVYATTPDVDRPLMQTLRTMLLKELDSALSGHREPRIGMLDLVAALSLGDWETAGRLVHGFPVMRSGGALHLMSKRNDVPAVKWLLDHGANPNTLWAHWDAYVTPLHLAVLGGHRDIVSLLLDAGANPRMRDSKHDSDAIGWAEFFHRTDLIQILKTKAMGT